MGSSKSGAEVDWASRCVGGRASRSSGISVSETLHDGWDFVFRRNAKRPGVLETRFLAASTEDGSSRMGTGP